MTLTKDYVCSSSFFSLLLHHWKMDADSWIVQRQPMLDLMAFAHTFQNLVPDGSLVQIKNF